jgi:hypothetical protein
MKHQLLLAFAALLALADVARSQGTTFAYQGRLNLNGVPAYGSYDLTFALFNVSGGAGQVGRTLTSTATSVSNGLFTVTLDFGNQFPGANRWLEIAVRTNGGGAFTTLAPRQPLTPTPYAIYAGGVNAAGLSGTIAPANIGAGAIAGNMLADGAVTTAKIASNAVTSAQIAPGAVGQSQLARKYVAGRIAVDAQSGVDFGDPLTIATPFGCNFGVPPVLSYDLERTNETTIISPDSISLLGKTATNFILKVQSLPAHSTVVYDKFSSPVTRVDQRNDFGQYNAMATVAGNPAISFFDAVNNRLYFVRALDNTGNTWSAPVAVNTAGAGGSWTSLLVVNGNPAISYRDDATKTVRYVRATDSLGSSWGAPVTIVASDAGPHTTLTVVNGNPGIGFTTDAAGTLKYVRATDANGSTWPGSQVTVSSGHRLAYPSLKVVNGIPAMAFQDSTSGDLAFVRASDANGTVWPMGLVLDFGASDVSCAGAFATLEVVNGNPAIAYYSDLTCATNSSTVSQARYVRALDASGSSWGLPVTVGEGTILIETVTTTHSGPYGQSWTSQHDVLHRAGADAGRFIRLAVINGVPAVIYRGASTERISTPIGSTSWAVHVPPRIDYVGRFAIQFARAQDASGASWKTPVMVNVEDATDLGLVLSGSVPAICYYQEGALHYRAASQTSGDAWTRGSIDFKTGLGLIEPARLVDALVQTNGLPVVFYHDARQSDLRMAQATNLLGRGWSAGVAVNEVIDAGKNVGVYTSIAAINGGFGVAYQDVDAGDLKYTFFDGTHWARPVTVDASGYTGYGPSLAIIQGFPAIAYMDGTTSTLKYIGALDARGQTWGTPVTVAAASFEGGNIQLLTANGNPAIGYVSLGFKFVRATSTTGTTWAAPVSVAAAYAPLSMTLVNGNPAAIFRSTASSQLQYVRATDSGGAAWGSVVTVDATTGTGNNNSLAVINGYPAVTYTGGGTLNYRRASDANGSAWGAPVLVAATAGQLGDVELRLVGELPAVCYHNFGTGHPYFVRAAETNGAQWSAPVALDSDGAAGGYNSMVFDGTTVAISYYDAPGGALRVARSASLGESWPLADIPDGGGVGKYLSAAILNGLPAVSYYDEFNGDLKFAKGRILAPPNGPISWQRFTLDATGDAGLYTSLVVMSNGILAISYYDLLNGNLKFIRASNTTATVWYAPVTLDSAGDVGRFASMALVNGNPAIAYQDVSNGDLRYIRALDAGGTNWGVPVIVDSGTNSSSQNVGQFASLAVVNGRPAVAYYYADLKRLSYVRANDANGGTWGTPIPIDPTPRTVNSGYPYFTTTTQTENADRGRNATLRIISGRPAILYYDTTVTKLRYIHATDADGSSWGSPLELDSVPAVGLYGTLVEVNGSPSVTYSDTVYGVLKNLYPIKPFQINWFAIEP